MSPYVVVSDKAAAREILSDTKVFVKGSDYTEKFGVAFGEGLVTSNGETHKAVKGAHTHKASRCADVSCRPL